MAEEPFQVTAEEVDKISKALKDEEFRKLFFEYAKEISDPENKKRYEAELIELERMRGVDMKFLKPRPGFVLKSLILPEGKENLFVNMCISDSVKMATNSSAEIWNIPYSLTPPREDQDKEKKKCTVVDAVFHSGTYKLSEKNARFRQMLVDSALDGIERNFKIKCNRKKVKTLKLTYKGMPSMTVIRTPKEGVEDRPETVDLGGLPLKVPYPPLKETHSSTTSKPKRSPKEKRVIEPHYSIVYSGEFTMQDFTNDRDSSRVKRPRSLIVKIELPGLESASSVELDIYEKRLMLGCASPLYKLDLALSYPVDSDKGAAKFDKVKRTLTVTLPVLPPPPAATVQPKPLITEVESETTEELNPSNQNEDEGSCDSTTDQNGHQTMTEPTNQVEDKGGTSQAIEDWSSVGEWCCPPFSYRQDDSTVTFVLHTPGVKEKSMVANFDQEFAQLTYMAATGDSYSFFVCFVDGCTIEADDCVVDVSDENVVLLLTKDSKGVWSKFQVGLNASQTKEKLFLTELNVQSAIEEMESFPDPWVCKGPSIAAQVKVVSQSESHLNIEIDDPTSTRETSINDPTSTRETPIDDPTSTRETSIDDPTSTRETPTASTAEEGDSSQDCKETTKHSESKHTPIVKSSSGSCSTFDAEGPCERKSLPSKSGSYERDERASSMTVEADGSVFVRVDTDYVESRAKGHVTLDGQKAREGDIKFSNKLLFSLD